MLFYVEVEEQYQVKLANRFAAMGNLDDDVDISRAWKVLQYKCFCHTQCSCIELY